MPSDMISIRARTIAIIGAGPSGVIAAKYLRAEKAFDKIVLFEQRDRPGGIWNYTGDQTSEHLFSIPQTDPHKGHQKPKWEPSPHLSSSNSDAASGETTIENTHNSPSFLSPMYESLETNIPRGLMGFQDLPWPPETQLFPTHPTVLKYISDYSADVQHLVQYETQVTNILPSDASNFTSPWTITTLNLRTGTSSSSNFDAVIVANGHFTVPYVPTIPGMQEWNKQHPGRITHSKYFRRATDYTNKKVVVVGNSASGSDISNQMAQASTLPLLWSTRSASLFSASHGDADAQRRREVPAIARFIPEGHSVEFIDGTVERDVDAVVFATGYFYSLPFLEQVTPRLVTDGSHVQNTYEHLFYYPRPTLSFLALNQRVIPFPLAEAQAAVVARVYSGRLALPSSSQMQKWEIDTLAALGDADTRAFHLLPFPRDAEYINAMSGWALSAAKRDTLENDGKGKIPPVWGDWEFWCRERFPSIRRAFGMLGVERFGVRRIEEVGFKYEDFVREREKERLARGRIS